MAVFPENGVKYELAGEAYLNFANQGQIATNLEEFVTSPDGAREDLNRITRNYFDNNIATTGGVAAGI